VSSDRRAPAAGAPSLRFGRFERMLDFLETKGDLPVKAFAAKPGK
jgi:hypothetical protein